MANGACNKVIAQALLVGILGGVMGLVAADAMATPAAAAVDITVAGLGEVHSCQDAAEVLERGCDRSPARSGRHRRGNRGVGRRGPHRSPTQALVLNAA
jgi:hypothetical protein